jgi:hypothetical protein
MIELKAKSFAKNVAIDLGEKALFFEDNFFDMDAGSVRRVVVKTTGRGPLRKKDLSIRALANL